MHYVNPHTYVRIENFYIVRAYFEELGYDFDNDIVAVDHRTGDESRVMLDVLKSLWKGDPPKKNSVQCLLSYDPFPMIQMCKVFSPEILCYFIPRLKAEELVEEHRGQISGFRYGV